MRRRTGVAWILAAVCLAALALPAAAQTKTLVWDRYDVNLTVQPNGDLQVVETQTIRFTSGTFTYGYAEIPLGRTAGIDQVSVSEPDGTRYLENPPSGDPHSLSVSTSGDNLEIRWYFPQAGNQRRTFILSYVAHGAVRIYDSGDKLQWIAIDNQRDFPVMASTVTVKLPPGAQVQSLATFGVQADQQTNQDGTQATLVAVSQLGPADRLEVGVGFTHGVIPAVRPPWQAGFDRSDFYARHIKPAASLLLLFLALVIGGGGPLLAYLRWYSGGRDPSVGVVPEYLSEPPDETPPGVLGTLIDEKADMQDILASLIDLARRDFLSIQEVKGQGLLGLGGTEFSFQRGEQSWDSLNGYEKEILKGIFPPGTQERSLSDLHNKFYTSLPAIKKGLYQELVDRGFFSRSPEEIRKAGRRTGIIIASLGLLGAFYGHPFFDPYVSFSGWLFAAMVICGVALTLGATYMPAKTRKGAEAAARWRAFRTYLERIERLTDIQQAGDLFERYLPYAVAFGMNNSWIQKFSKLQGAPAPIWYVPYHTGGMASAGHTASPAPRGGLGGLQGMSDGMAGGLQGMSDGLTRMLNSAGRTMGSSPSSSGGGGFGSGGGGGGGGRGFG
jgi:uncharacterized membrane protein